MGERNLLGGVFDNCTLLFFIILFLLLFFNGGIGFRGKANEIE